MTGATNPSTLTTVTVPDGPTAAAILLPPLTAALDGTGPAVAPLPGEPAARARALAAVVPDRPLERPAAVVVPTSGSTGEPKAVLLTAAALAASGEATAAHLGGGGQWLLTLPAAHVAGLQVVARSVLAGTEPVAVDLRGGFTPEAFAAAAARMSGPRRYTSLVPTQLGTLLDAGGPALDALGGLDAVLLGGSAAPESLLRRARAAGVRIVVTYGMTETCGGCVYDGTPLACADVRLESAPAGTSGGDPAGPPRSDPAGTSGGDPAGAGTAEAEPGRITIGGSMLFGGYRLRPDLTAAALTPEGRFATSDLGRWTADGRLRVLGRIDDMIITGGLNVAPAEVEAALADHPAVAEAAVVGVPDERWGQRVVAVLAPRSTDAAPTLEALRDHVGRRIGRRSAPRGLVLVERLPRLAGLGKVDRQAVRRLAATAD
ncbi:AMP-binding protein [Allostreptomyces psammosilenae]|uniref:O-succinylbenzoic acid--CoA ligase n=1 Tax=Allostreptomyces psammosilenae TaxID=1892865 RepID=A0A852ZYM0_9ACTN|nr:AMP-binding protein [Allostreptomyces psammosilenae]NYI05814.1 O-succinylbenzoic acid--CoA ligase [Allostreptomyces psammosilenae]